MQTNLFVPPMDMSQVNLVQKKDAEVETFYPYQDTENVQDEGIPEIPKLSPNDFEIEYQHLDEHESRMRELRDQQTLLSKMASEDDTVNNFLKQKEAAEYEAYLARQVEIQQAEIQKTTFVQSLGVSQDDEKEVMSLMNEQVADKIEPDYDKNRPAQTA